MTADSKRYFRPRELSDLENILTSRTFWPREHSDGSKDFLENLLRAFLQTAWAQTLAPPIPPKFFSHDVTPSHDEWIRQEGGEARQRGRRGRRLRIRTRATPRSGAPGPGTHLSTSKARMCLPQATLPTTKRASRSLRRASPARGGFCGARGGRVSTACGAGAGGAWLVVRGFSGEGTCVSGWSHGADAARLRREARLRGASRKWRGGTVPERVVRDRSNGPPWHHVCYCTCAAHLWRCCDHMSLGLMRSTADSNYQGGRTSPIFSPSERCGMDRGWGGIGVGCVGATGLRGDLRRSEEGLREKAFRWMP